MKRNPKMLPLVFIMGAGGGFVLWHAMQTGHPVFYFLSAVLFGVGFAALQKR